ncbi:MAG TPA: DUF4097 family beta strand repeat-containing protein [Gaiellaceae bacterium]|jgi:hypothetical protein
MERSFEVTGPAWLDLRLAAGEIEVDATLEDRVEVELTARDDESQRLVDAARVELRDAGGRAEVLVDVPSRQGAFDLSILFGRQSGVSCRVRCPRGSAVKARTRSAGVTAGPELGPVDVATASGDVELRDVDGDLNAKTASGDIAVRRVTGHVSANSASGDVTIEAAEGPLSVNTASGDVHVGDAFADVKANTASGDLRVSAVQEGTVTVNSASGDVEVGVRRGARAYLDCSTVSGDARSELEPTDDEPDGDGPFVEIRARTMSGDIRITRAQEVRA